MKFLINRTFLFFTLFLFSPLAMAEIYKFKGIVDVINGKLFPSHFIEIQNGKIVRLTDTISSKTKYLDYSSFFLSPGLIDSHTHIFVSQILADGNFSNALKREIDLPEKERISRARKYLKQYLGEGFTSIFDLGNSGYFLDVALRNKLRKNALYPSLYVSGPGIAAFPGQFPPSTPSSKVSNEYVLVDNKTDISKMIDLYVEKKVDILKIYLDNYPAPGRIDESVLKKILNHPHISKFKKITFHSFIPESGTLLRKFQIKSTEHFNFYMGETFPSGLVYITPTNFDSQTMKQFNQFTASYYLLQQNVLKKIYKAKLKILFGPDFYFEDQKDPDYNRAKLVKRTLNSFIEAKIDPVDILQMITYNPALSIGMQNQIGQISAGSIANLIGTRANPLVDTTTLFEIPLVINKGKIILSK